MKKILGLDLGDAWVGVAASDFLKIAAKPYKTFACDLFDQGLLAILTQEPVEAIVVGLPLTLGQGGDSDQTKKIRQEAVRLQELVAQAGYSEVKFILWDERLSSKRAAAISKKPQSKEEKLMQHAKAAAFVLQSYLDHLSFSAAA